MGKDGAPPRGDDVVLTIDQVVQYIARGSWIRLLSSIMPKSNHYCPGSAHRKDPGDASSLTFD